MSWGSIVGSLVANVLGDSVAQSFKFGESAYNAHLQRDLMSYQNAQNQFNWHTQLTQGPTLERKGLESAGFNPLLAIHGGVQTPSIGGQSALAAHMSSGSPFEGFGHKIKEALESTLVEGQKDLQEKELESLDADIALKESQAVKTAYEAQKTLSEIPLVEADTTKTKVSTVTDPARLVVGTLGGAASGYAVKKIQDMFKDKGAERGLNSLQRQRIEQLRKVVKNASRRSPSLGSKVLQSLGIFAAPVLPAYGAYQMNRHLERISPSARRILNTPNLGSRLR